MENIRSLTLMAENMRRLRKIKHLTQEELAYRTGLHPYSIGLIERKVKAPSLRSVEKIARALGVSVAELVSESANQKKMAEDARGQEIAQMMRRLETRKADALLGIIKTLVETFADAGRNTRLKVAEGGSTWVMDKQEKKK